jgi:hypothetical protein
LIGGLLSFGTFRVVVKLIMFLAEKINWLKKFIIGNEYLNGKWIGYYRGVSGDIRYIVETFEQNFDELKIRGHSYNENLELHSSWESKSLSIDGNSGKLIYAYAVTGIIEPMNGIGIAEFDFERAKKNEIPKIIRDFSIDSHIGKKIASYEEKVIEKNIPSEKELVLQAKSIYESNPEFKQQVQRRPDKVF